MLYNANAFIAHNTSHYRQLIRTAVKQSSICICNKRYTAQANRRTEWTGRLQYYIHTKQNYLKKLSLKTAVNTVPCIPVTKIHPT